MKRAMIVMSMLVTALPAYAGKAERDYMEKSVMPTIKEATTKWKTSCGCDLSIKIDDKTIVKEDDMHQIRYIAENVGEGAAAYCTDAASKKAVCAMKTLTLGKAKEATFSFSGGKGVATTDGQSNCSWEMMTRELDK